MQYENIEIPKNHRLPYKILIHEVKIVPYHWHDFLEIIFVIKGSVQLEVEKKDIVLGEGDVFLVNSCYRHAIKSQSHNNILYALQIREDFLRSEIESFDSLTFGVSHHTSVNDIALLKKYLSELALLDIKKKENINILRKVKVLEILNLVQHRFSIDRDEQESMLSSKEKY